MSLVLQALKTNLVKSQNLQPHEGLKRSGLSSLVLDEADLILSKPGYESDLQTLAPKVRSQFNSENCFSI